MLNCLLNILNILLPLSAMQFYYERGDTLAGAAIWCLLNVYIQLIAGRASQAEIKAFISNSDKPATTDRQTMTVISMHCLSDRRIGPTSVIHFSVRRRRLWWNMLSTYDWLVLSASMKLSYWYKWLNRHISTSPFVQSKHQSYPSEKEKGIRSRTSIALYNFKHRSTCHHSGLFQTELHCYYTQ